MSRRHPSHAPVPPPPPAARGSRGVLPALVAAAAAVTTLLGAWWWQSRPAPGPAARDLPDVLLVTIDTLRADHLGCYGNRDAATPVLDALAARGVRFADAIAPVPLTLPSHASLLTGTTPLVHGVRDNAGFVLGAAPLTVAEAFRSAGYSTAAFVSGFPVSRRFGLARGFDAYDDRFPRGDDPARPSYVERRADETVTATTEWLRQQPPDAARPLFAWVHLFDPHAPYEAPEPYRSRFRQRPYDGEIAFADAQLGALLAAWRSRRPGRDPLVVVTADHGEGLGEHGEPTHGLFIYDSTLRVPLIASGPGVPEGRTVAGAVGLVDVAPTLLDLAGLPPLKDGEGRSLRGAMASGRGRDEAVYAESLFARLGFGWAPLHGWRHRGLMFIDAPRSELYDTATDPAELTNLAAERPDEAERMRRAVQAAVAKGKTPRPAPAGREAAERLRSLGYVASQPAGSPSLRDPKDFAALAVRIENAIAAERTAPAGAVSEFLAALREDPGNVVVRRHLAMALVAGKQYDAAAKELQALVSDGDTSLETLTLLGDSHRLAGRPTEALAAFDRACGVDAAAPEGHIGRGKVLTAQGRTDEARQAFERALRTAPEDAEALEGLADLALARGDTLEARARMNALTARDPADARLALKHGVLLVREGHLDAAVAVFRRVVERDPANADAALDLGGALAKAGRPAEAVFYFERAIAAGASGSVVWNGLAMARLESGNRAGAVEALRQSLRADPRQPRINGLLNELQR